MLTASCVDGVASLLLPSVRLALHAAYMSCSQAGLTTLITVVIKALYRFCHASSKT